MELIGLGKCALPEGARMPKHPHYQDALRPKRKPIQCLLYKAQGVTSDGCARKDPHVEGICQLCGHAAHLSLANVSQKPNRIPKDRGCSLYLSADLFARRSRQVFGCACAIVSLAPKPVGAFPACSGGNTQLGQKPLGQHYVERDKSDNPHPLGHICSDDL